MYLVYEDIEDLEKQRNQLYDEAIKQQENIVNTSTQQTIDEIERNKEKAAKEAEKTNRALYTDYQKQINPYGVNAENLAEYGLNRSGMAETTRANYYNTYQNARTEATNNANTIKADFDAEIARARQNGDLQKAQAAQNMYLQKISDLATMYNLKFQANQFNYQKEQDALSQSNWEKEYAQALQQAQWQQAFNQAQFDYQKTRDAVADSQWEKEYQLSKKKSTASRSSGGSSGGNKNPQKNNEVDTTDKDKQEEDSKLSTFANRVYNTAKMLKKESAADLLAEAYNNRQISAYELRTIANKLGI